MTPAKDVGHDRYGACTAMCIRHPQKPPLKKLEKSANQWESHELKVEFKIAVKESNGMKTAVNGDFAESRRKEEDGC